MCIFFYDLQWVIWWEHFGAIWLRHYLHVESSSLSFLLIYTPLPSRTLSHSPSDENLVSGLLMHSKVCLMESAGVLLSTTNWPLTSLSDNHMDPAGIQLPPEEEIHHDSVSRCQLKCIVAIRWLWWGPAGMAWCGCYKTLLYDSVKLTYNRKKKHAESSIKAWLGNL